MMSKKSNDVPEPIKGREIPYSKSDLKKIEEFANIRERLLEILEYVNSEWKSDFHSTVCFDFRIIREADNLLDRYNKLKEIVHNV